MYYNCSDLPDLAISSKGDSPSIKSTFSFVAAVVMIRTYKSTGTNTARFLKRKRYKMQKMKIAITHCMEKDRATSYSCRRFGTKSWIIKNIEINHQNSRKTRWNYMNLFREKKSIKSVKTVSINYETSEQYNEFVSLSCRRFL